jgi:hypothetical protein
MTNVVAKPAYPPTVKSPEAHLCDVVRSMTNGGKYNKQMSLIAGFPTYSGESELLTSFAACNAVSIDDGETYSPFVYLSHRLVSLCGGVIGKMTSAVLLHEAGHLINGDVDVPTGTLADYTKKEVRADDHAFQLGHGADLLEVLVKLREIGKPSQTLDHRIMILQNKVSEKESMGRFETPEFSLCSLVGRKVICLGGRKFLDPVKNEVFTQETGIVVVIGQLPTAVWNGTHKYYYSQKLDKLFGVRGEIHMKREDPRRALAISTWMTNSKG